MWQFDNAIQKPFPLVINWYQNFCLYNNQRVFNIEVLINYLARLNKIFLISSIDQKFAVLVNRQYFLEDIYPKNIYFLSYSPKQKCSINLNLHLTLRIRQSISCPTNFLFHLLFMFLLKNTLRKHKAFSPELFSIETNRRVQTSQFPTR